MNQPVEDPPSSRFTWRIENFSSLNKKKLYSEIFIVGGYKWRVLIFPKGNNVDHLSMYLDVADSGSLPIGWSRYAQFSLAVINQIRTKSSVRKETQHQFNALESDWGFTAFLPLGEFYEPDTGYLVNDTLIVEAEVIFCRAVDNSETANAAENQPVEDPETANAAENQPMEDPLSSRFTWRIENFSRLNNKKHYSEIFIVGGYKWRVLIFPKGNNVDHLSMYLDVADSGSLPNGWSRYAQFSLAVINQIRTKSSVRKDTQHQFDALKSEWGFTSFMPLGELNDPGRGYLVNDTLIVEADVIFRRAVDNSETANAAEATKSCSEVIMSLNRLGENLFRQVEQIGLQNILENPAAALELSKRLRFPGIKDLKNVSSDELMASMPSEVSVVQDKVVLYAFLKMLESRMSNLSAEVALCSSKLAEAEAKLKSYESSEADLNSRVESLEAELIKKQAENEALKNQASASEQKASSSQKKALFLEAELIRKEAENEVLKNQSIASEQKASSSEQKALFLARTILKRDKYSKDLSDAASKLIEDSSGSGKSKDQGADLRLVPSSS